MPGPGSPEEDAKLADEMKKTTEQVFRPDFLQDRKAN
jgi:hypothetical protein